MTWKTIVFNCCCCVLASGWSMAVGEVPLYRNPDESISKRVEDLLGRMTLEEKVGQMCQYTGQGVSKDVRDKMARGEIGSFLHVLSAKQANDLQTQARNSRLGIPLLIGIDAIHGNGLHAGSTIYPSPIGMASTFDPGLVKEMHRQTAIEMRTAGMHWTFAPNVEIGRDARWGRMGETFGEDTCLVSNMGVAAVEGLQGKLMGGEGVLSTTKHYIAGGEPNAGLNGAPMDLSERKLREVYLPPFEAAVKAGTWTVMPAHNEVNGVPCHAQKHLIEGVLRGELGFHGFTVSDWMDIEYLFSRHHVATSMDDAFAKAVEAGLDMHMQGPLFFEGIVKAVQSGRIPEERIDRGVRRILESKFRLGLFEKDLVDLAAAEKTSGNPVHMRTSLEAARRSVVMLKNDGILPLSHGQYKKICVIGPNAANHTLLGDWALKQPDEKVCNVFRGIQTVAGDCELVLDDCGGSIVNMNGKHIDAAAAKAAQSDLNIVVVGENSLRYAPGKTCGENNDRDNISLPGRQVELIDAVQAAGKPVIVVLINGRPLDLCKIQQQASAILEAWEPGSQGGLAIAEILWGQVNPSGKLPVTFPRNAGQIPTIYNYRPSQYSRRYAMGPTGALYQFGYGLSYTEFSFDNVRLDKKEISPGESAELKVTVANSGGCDGEEVVQVYVTDEYSSVTLPVKQLKHFKRISLKKGESREVSFTVTPEDLSLLNEAMKKVVEPGKFRIGVGNSSRDGDLKYIDLIVRDSVAFDEKYRYSRLKLDQPEIPVDGQTRLTVHVENIGNSEKEAAIPLTISAASGAPVHKTLNVVLKRGESRDVKLDIVSGDLIISREDLNQPKVEPGVYRISVGDPARNEEVQSIDLKVR